MAGGSLEGAACCEIEKFSRLLRGFRARARLRSRELPGYRLGFETHQTDRKICRLHNSTQARARLRVSANERCVPRSCLLPVSPARFLCRRLSALRDLAIVKLRAFHEIIEVDNPLGGLHGYMKVADTLAAFYTARSINPSAMHRASGISAAISRKSLRLEPVRLLNCRESRPA